MFRSAGNTGNAVALTAAAVMGSGNGTAASNSLYSPNANSDSSGFSEQRDLSAGGGKQIRNTCYVTLFKHY